MLRLRSSKYWPWDERNGDSVYHYNANRDVRWHRLFDRWSAQGWLGFDAIGCSNGEEFLRLARVAVNCLGVWS
jgi:hypothetical protein